MIILIIILTLTLSNNNIIHSAAPHILSRTFNHNNIVNNNLRIFPRITTNSSASIWVEWKEVTDRDNVLRTRYSGSVDTISDISNAPYDNMKYNSINDVGKQWIRKYGLALSKELLGMVRIPNSEVSLDGETLRAEATAEKEQLVEQLREMLDQTSNKALMEADRESSDNLQEKLKKVPYPMYIG